MVDRLDDLAPPYRTMNVSEILDRIEEIGVNFMANPGQDIDDFLGDSEEIVELVWAVRAHMGLPIKPGNLD